MLHYLGIIPITLQQTKPTSQDSTKNKHTNEKTTRHIVLFSRPFFIPEKLK